MYQLLTLVLSTVRSLFNLDNNAFQSVDRASSIAADITSRKLAGEQATRRQAEMSDDATEWGVWSDTEAAGEISGSHLIALRGNRCRTNFYGPLRLELAEGPLTLFDFGIYLGERQSTLAPILQTVGSYRISELDAPSFYMRPILNRSSVRNEFLSCYGAVDSLSAGSFNQIVEGLFPGRIAELFDTKTAFTELLPMVQERQLTLEWTGETLLAYRLQQTASRDEIPELASEIVQVAKLLQAASAEASAAKDQQVALAAGPR